MAVDRAAIRTALTPAIAPGVPRRAARTSGAPCSAHWCRSEAVAKTLLKGSRRRPDF